MAANYDLEAEDAQQELNNTDAERNSSISQIAEVARLLVSHLISPHTPTQRFNRLATPQSRRLMPKLRRESWTSSFTYGYQEFIRKQWRMYSLSPLCNFKSDPAALARYASSLDATLAQDQSTSTDASDGRPLKSDFSFYEPLRFSPDDPSPLRIQVLKQSGEGISPTVVMEAFLVCVELSSHPVPPLMRELFTYYPVIFIGGNRSKFPVLLQWLERHFDCLSYQLTLSNNDMRYMLAVCSSSLATIRCPPVLLEYSMEQCSRCQGIQQITCNFEPNYCKYLWQRLFGDPSSKLEIFKNEVDLFVDKINTILSQRTEMNVKQFPFSEVGTSVAYVSFTGKIKFLTSHGLYGPLHLLCEIANDRLMGISARKLLSN